MSDDQSSLDTNDFVTYTEGNLTCGAEWPGAQMAILPTTEHNSILAALMGTGDIFRIKVYYKNCMPPIIGPYYFGSDAWIGIYNYAYYDYYFRIGYFE